MDTSGRNVRRIKNTWLVDSRIMQTFCPSELLLGIKGSSMVCLVDAGGGGDPDHGGGGQDAVHHLEGEEEGREEETEKRRVKTEETRERIKEEWDRE